MTAASTASRSMRVGQLHSKSAMGLKRPRRLSFIRRSTLRRARSVVSSSATWDSSSTGAPAFLGGSGDDVVEVAGDGVQAERDELLRERGRHATPPSGVPSPDVRFVRLS